MEFGMPLFITAALIILVWFFIEVKRMKHKVFAILLIVLIVLTYVSGILVFKDQEVDYKSVSGLVEAGKVYVIWLGSVFTNVKTITAQAISMDWAYENSTDNK